MDCRWENISTKVNKAISKALRQIMKGLRKMDPILPEATNYCQCLLSLMKNPWGHRNFLKLLCGNPSHREGNLLK